MIEYKDAEFYSDYFKSLEGFSIIEEFKESKEDDEKKLFVGYVEVLNTIHPLIVRVEIPFTFPHNKLTFRTKSISGYPHLIHSGKTKHGDWFCLNTPFAETVEEQLNQEVLRLKEWINHQMREDLPSVIEDSNVKKALAFANAYEWENPEEMKEFCSHAMLTFVGNFHNDIEYFKDNFGYLNCIKSPDNRFYAIADEKIADFKLPYVIVNEVPSSIEVFSDLFKLKEHYNWDDTMLEHLLPNMKLSSDWKRSTSQPFSTKKWTKEEALKQISIIEEKFSKEILYLYETKQKKECKVLPIQKDILRDEINQFKNNIDTIVNSTPSTLKEYAQKCMSLTSYETEEDLEELQWQEYYSMEVYPFEWHHFALGIKTDNEIYWKVYFTNRFSKRSEELNFDLGIKTIRLSKTNSLKLQRLCCQVITEEMFFGRGAFSIDLKSKRIAIVGLGAIGSMVASALARTGISKIGLWDNDIVEPGNICRSSYTLKHLGESKVRAIVSLIKSINPYIKTHQINGYGYWFQHNANFHEYQRGSFYDNINYNSQEVAVKEIKDYDLIIDCTGSNEILHFLSYAVPETDILSLCITNHANELLCITNKDGNPFELRKAYLSRIEQDTKNFYVEGDGCYSPTFLATNSDIAALVNLALRDLNINMENEGLMHSTIYSYSQRGIIADKIHTYQLDGYDITLNISSETIYDAEDIEDSFDGNLGYIFGSYSKDGRQIMITHMVDSENAKDLLTDAYKTSKGLIDYIGDYCYSTEREGTYHQSSLELIASKAADFTINTNNPLLAVRNPDRSISFFLYINNELVKFTELP